MLSLPEIPSIPLHVGFSGGADSTALLLALHEAGAEIEAVHFHHGIRGDDADADATHCAEFCEGRKIPFRLVELDVPARRLPRESVEMAARRLRLEWYQEQGACTVALGHHQDDLIETYLLRLMRGANASGLCGLRKDHRIGDLRIIRPLLNTPRAELLDWLAERGIAFRLDASNEDLSIPRNRVRATLLPAIAAFPGGREGILRSIEFLRQDAAILEAEAEAVAADFALSFPIAVLLAAEFARWPRLLSVWLGRPVGAGALRNLHEGLMRGAAEHAEFAVDDGLILRVERGQLTFAESARSATYEYAWDWQAAPRLRVAEIEATLSVDDAGERFAELPCPLMVRSRRPGDRMIPFGRRSPVRLKKLIQEARLTPEAKARLCVIATESGEIIWVPGVRRAAFGEVKPGQQCTRLSLSTGAAGCGR